MLRMTNTTFQNIDLPSWDTLYIPKRAFIEVVLQNCILEVLGSNVCRNTGYPD
jgi:hypothetical protein